MKKSRPKRPTKCPACGGHLPSRAARLDRILGPEFFVVLELRDLNPSQRQDVELRAQFCSDACADIEKLRRAME